MDVCKTCIRDQISSQLETQGSKSWDKLSCPLCSRNLTHEEIQKFASTTDFGKYERFCLIEHLSKEPDFRWCLSSTCKSGQLYENVPTWSPRVTCSDCSFSMCFTHQTPWHGNLTCKEYDHQIAHAEEEAESEKWKDTHTKKCPGKGCARPIEKGEGCFHMTCRECGWEFCWECLAGWDEVKRDKSRHKVGCYFRTPDVGPMGVRGVTVNVAVNQ